MLKSFNLLKFKKFELKRSQIKTLIGGDSEVFTSSDNTDTGGGDDGGHDPITKPRKPTTSST